MNSVLNLIFNLEIWNAFFNIRLKPPVGGAGDCLWLGHWSFTQRSHSEMLTHLCVDQKRALVLLWLYLEVFLLETEQTLTIVWNLIIFQFKLYNIRIQFAVVLISRKNSTLVFWRHWHNVRILLSLWTKMSSISIKTQEISNCLGFVLMRSMDVFAVTCRTERCKAH